MAERRSLCTGQSGLHGLTCAIQNAEVAGVLECRSGIRLRALSVSRATCIVSVMATMSVQRSMQSTANNHFGAELRERPRGCTRVCRQGVNTFGSGTTRSARGSGRNFTEGTAHSLSNLQRCSCSSGTFDVRSLGHLRTLVQTLSIARTIGCQRTCRFSSR